MRSLLAATLIGTATLVAAPAFAQSVYIGPGGVGVDSGLGRGYGYGHDDYRDRGYDRGRDEYRRNRFYEGRSAYERDGRRGDYRSYGDR